VLWEDYPKANIGFVNATFINRNNFATYANMAILAVLALLLEPFLRAGSLGDLRRIAAEAVEKLLDKRGPLLLVLLVSASLLTASRGGLVSLVAALVALVLIVLFMTRPSIRVIMPATALGCLVVRALVTATGTTMVERLESGRDGLRLPIYQDTLSIIADRPLLEHGYGSFVTSFLRYMDQSASPLVVDKAHNTYLEHAAELGIPATVLLYLAPLLLFLFLFCLRGAFVRRKEKVFPLLAVSATVLVAVHSLMDFSLQIPAVAVTYAMILGMGTAQSIPSPRASGPGASLR
jgi:O-antigen ligase